MRPSRAAGAAPGAAWFLTRIIWRTALTCLVWRYRQAFEAPVKWCILGTSTCARFFGGVSRSSKHAVMWQWSGGGGVTSGIGDCD
jgi:hypothetical protein